MLLDPANLWTKTERERKRREKNHEWDYQSISIHQSLKIWKCMPFQLRTEASYCHYVWHRPTVSAVTFNESSCCFPMLHLTMTWHSKKIIDIVIYSHHFVFLLLGKSNCTIPIILRSSLFSFFISSPDIYNKFHKYGHVHPFRLMASSVKHFKLIIHLITHTDSLTLFQPPLSCF